MSYDNLSSVSQNVLKFYQQLTGENIGFVYMLLQKTCINDRYNLTLKLLAPISMPCDVVGINSPIKLK
jgi:hypothetical protein